MRLTRALITEFIGTAALLATVVGSGIMAETLSQGNIALALLANAAATGAILYVLITTLCAYSGAHFNPAVTLAFMLQEQIARREAIIFMTVQIVGAVVGVLIAHMMFDVEIVQIGNKPRHGFAQVFSEVVASFGLVLTILLGVRHRAQAVAALVGAYIFAAYFFTASTSFANPAVTIARALTQTFSGIAPGDVIAVIGAQGLGAILAVFCYRLLEPRA